MGKPEIRFKGYTDEWEQRKLGEVTQCLDSERVPINSEEREKIPGEIPYYGAGNIQGYINKFLFDEELVLLLEDGDAFDDFRTKEIAQYICGKTWVNNHAHVLRPLGDAYFLYVTLSHKDIRNWVQLAGASRKKLVQKSMFDIELFMPHIIEQKKIGQYFSNLDDLITLHQRKCDEVKSLKKYMLQKMFPQNEQKVPKIRFEGFTEAWEQRKLGEVAEIGDIDHRMPDSVETGIPYLMTGDFIGENGLNFKGVKNISEEDYSSLSRKIKPEQGDILFARYASVGAVRYVDFTRKFLISYSCAIIKQSPKINSCYLYYYLISEGAQTQIKLETKTGSQANIGIDSMKKYINIPIPEQDEQKKIGDYFRNLDHLITLHQQKCEELKKTKKFMLQKMFV